MSDTNHPSSSPTEDTDAGEADQKRSGADAPDVAAGGGLRHALSVLNNAGVGIIIGALVAFLPAEYTRRADVDEARRVRIEERKVDAYAALLEDLNRSYYLAELFALTAITEDVAPGTEADELLGTEGLVPTRPEMLTFYQEELIPSSVQVELVGSPELAVEARRITTEFLATINGISDETLARFQSRVSDFSAAARAELS